MAALGTELPHGSGWCWATISPGFMRQIDLISGQSRCGYEALILGRDVGCTAKDFPRGLRFAAVLSPIPFTLGRSVDPDGLSGWACRLWPLAMLCPLDVVGGHLAFDDARSSTQALRYQFAADFVPCGGERFCKRGCAGSDSSAHASTRSA
jgi:hypothetical protein